jgi:hypothetical protein
MTAGRGTLVRNTVIAGAAALLLAGSAAAETRVLRIEGGSVSASLVDPATCTFFYTLALRDPSGPVFVYYEIWDTCSQVRLAQRSGYLPGSVLAVTKHTASLTVTESLAATLEGTGQIGPVLLTFQRTGSSRTFGGAFRFEDEGIVLSLQNGTWTESDAAVSGTVLWLPADDAAGHIYSSTTRNVRFQTK